uniref:Uncharacterized protein n=1 Tax=Chlorocebus sabaeus TaxID=60711 RepID=A0A0D9QUQ3_CHLSB
MRSVPVRGVHSLHPRPFGGPVSLPWLRTGRCRWGLGLYRQPSLLPEEICRLPHPVPELSERGDPDRSPGRAEGHLHHL